MIASPTPANEADRLQALRRLLILDTSPEERFDRITRLARRIFDTPIALISLVDAERQGVKSRVGLDLPETPRNLSFCAHAVAANQALLVPDATRDERFHDNPFVADQPAIRFYAGEVLRSANGLPLGTLCVIDNQPRDFSADDQAILRELAAIARDELNAISESRLAELLRHSEERFNLLVRSGDAGFFDLNFETGDAHCSARWKALSSWMCLCPSSTDCPQPARFAGRQMLPILQASSPSRSTALRGDRAKGLAAGMHDYLTQPFKTDELRQPLATTPRR